MECGGALITTNGISLAKHASDKRETCPPSNLHVAETGNVFPLSTRSICVSVVTNFVARYKVSEVAKLGHTERTSMSLVTCLLV